MHLILTQPVGIQALPELMASLLSRLDEVVDAHGLIEVLLGIMPKCNRLVQQGILELLPEIVLEQDCEVGQWSCMLHVSYMTMHALSAQRL